MSNQTREAARVAVVDRLVSTGVRSEATIQSDVRMLLLDPDLGLEEVNLETPAGEGRRIDIEVGTTVIEVKRSLASDSALEAARKQLAGYVTVRAAETGTRYVGILTDGTRWHAYQEVGGDIKEATRHIATAGASGAAALLSWLEGVLATKQGVRPTPAQVRERLGASSSSHQLDYAALAALYEGGRDLDTVKLKRELWAKLLTSALGTQFTDADELFLEHTLLVNSAEIIAHLVVGLPVTELPPASLLVGEQFAVAGLHGVVDRDFFDWVLEVPGGEAFVSSLARRLTRFDWSQVDHDVLKVLYESVIPAATRKALGEYYTPDWLAYEVVRETVTDPLKQRVLDPSCGSGSFLFYAVRHYLAAAEADGIPLADAMHNVSSHVIGIDLHPVAVALARVTYLLALGRDRLSSPERGGLSVPVYLGDSLGWDQREDLLSVGHLVIPTDSDGITTDLRFPEHLLDDAARFDDIIQALVDESGIAAKSTARRKPSQLSAGTVRRLALADADATALADVFLRLRQLHEADRDHIWSYYIRNVARPAWLTREANRVNVLVGNPPWLSYRHMSAEMQNTFRNMSKERGFWSDERTATHQDLAGLFIARATERFLARGGRFAFVVPNPVVDRDYWSGFRTGRFDAATNVQFTPSWDLRRLRPHLFPRGAAVVFATRECSAKPMPTDIVVWAGHAPDPHDLAGGPLRGITRTPGKAVVGTSAFGSSYATRFVQGANLVPRVLFRVKDDTSSVLGAPAGRKQVRSFRTAYEKEPWKDLADLHGIVENQFIWPTILGEHVLPFRLAESAQFVVPLTVDGNLLAGDTINAWPGVAVWMRRAEELWAANQGGKLTLSKQIDHMGKLTGQAPMPALRVVYAASGTRLAAAVLRDTRTIVEHGAYWTSVASEGEASYLVGVLNSPSLTELVRPFMSYGKDERHIDKNVWRLSIPQYDPREEGHQRVAALADDLTGQVAALSFDKANSIVQRREVRALVEESDAGRELAELVAQLVSG